MEEAAELGNYLPLSFKTKSEQEYIAFLWDAFESFEFLGFEFRWGQNRHKRPQVKRRTVRKKLRAACREMQAWIKKNRQAGIRPLMATLARKLRGHWNYFGVPHNS
jgi:hypothetical protein